MQKIDRKKQQLLPEEAKKKKKKSLKTPKGFLAQLNPTLFEITSVTCHKTPDIMLKASDSTVQKVHKTASIRDFIIQKA